MKSTRECICYVPPWMRRPVECRRCDARNTDVLLMAETQPQLLPGRLERKELVDQLQRIRGVQTNQRMVIAHHHCLQDRRDDCWMVFPELTDSIQPDAIVSLALPKRLQ